MPSMVTPIIDPVVEPSVTSALYPLPHIPVLSMTDPAPVLVASPHWQVGGSPVLDQSRSYLVSPPGSVSEPIPSRISGDSWPPAVVVVQRVHVLFRLLSRSPTVAAYDSGVSAERKL